MTSSNDITGDAIKSRAQNQAFSEGWDRIWGAKPASDMFQGVENTEKTQKVEKK